MRWKLAGFLGALAGLFVPNRGDALLSFEAVEQNRTRIQLLITAPRREGEYFVYGAEVDTVSGATAHVCSAQSFRGKSEAKSQSVEGEQVLDFASAVYLLRHRPPTERMVWKVWNRGKVYAAEIRPLAPTERRVKGERIRTRGYDVRGVDVPGSEPFDEKLTFYFALDEAATLVELSAKRGLIRLRLEIDAELASQVQAAGSAHPTAP